MSNYLKRWWKGVKDINPKQQLQIDIWSQIWQVAGMALATVYVCFTVLDYLVILFFGVFFGMAWKFYITVKTYEKLRKEESEFELARKTYEEEVKNGTTN